MSYLISRRGKTMSNKFELLDNYSNGKSPITAIPYKVDMDNENMTVGIKLVVFSKIEHGQHLVWVSRSFKGRLKGRYELSTVKDTFTNFRRTI